MPSGIPMASGPRRRLPPSVALRFGQRCAFCIHAAVHRAAALQIGRSSSSDGGMGARGQVRRLPGPASCAKRRSPDSYAQRSRLDRPIRGDRPESLEDLPDCMIDGEVSALVNNMPELRRTAGGFIGEPIRWFGVLCVRSPVRRPGGLPPIAPNHSQGAVEGIARGRRPRTPRFDTSSISNPTPTRSWCRPARCTSKELSRSAWMLRTFRAARAGGPRRNVAPGS